MGILQARLRIGDEIAREDYTTYREDHETRPATEIKIFDASECSTSIAFR